MHPLVPARPFQGVPSFFRALCHQASRGGPDNSYSSAAYELARHLAELESCDYADGEYASRRALLEQHVKSNDRRGVLVWFLEEFPRCMHLVPRRRREQIVVGVFQAFADGIANVEPWSLGGDHEEEREP